MALLVLAGIRWLLLRGVGEHWALCAVVLVGGRLSAEWDGVVGGMYACVLVFDATADRWCV